MPAIASCAAQVLILGGGFAGGACAMWLRRLAPELTVTVVEPHAVVHTGFFCNSFLGGLHPLSFIAQRPGGLSRVGVHVIPERVTGLEPEKRRAHLADGTKLQADVLVLAPGIHCRMDAVEGYGVKEAADNPSAWPGSGADLECVRRRLRGLPEGGSIVISVPAAPYRCPPGPYERVSLFAHHLARHNPRAKILVLDSKDAFSKDSLFLQAWSEHYPGMIEWVGRSDGGRVLRYEHGSQQVTTAQGEKVQADWVHLIPPQRAGDLAFGAGLGDGADWIPVRAEDMGVAHCDGVYVLGDAADVQPMPKSAYAAHGQARQCAAAIIARLRGRDHVPQWLANTCYSLVAPDYAFSVSSLYVPEDGVLRVHNPDSQLSPLTASRELRRREAREAEWLYRSLCAESFGVT